MEISRLDRLYAVLEVQDTKLKIMTENYWCFTGDEIRQAKQDLEQIKKQIRIELNKPKIKKIEIEPGEVLDTIWKENKLKNE